MNQSAPHANSIPSSLECLLLEYVAYDSLRQLGGVGSSAKALRKGSNRNTQQNWRPVDSGGINCNDINRCDLIYPPVN